MAKHFLRLPSVCEPVGFGRSQLYALIKQDKFPAPVRLGVRAVAWDSDLIDAWVQERIEASRARVAALAPMPGWSCVRLPSADVPLSWQIRRLVNEKPRHECPNDDG